MNLLTINELDNVSVCLDGSQEIPAGHKIARNDIAKGEFVIKYGQIIGRATQDIRAGEWVHAHNLHSHLDENPTYRYQFHAKEVRPQKLKFWGYPRVGRNAGIRNEIYIIPSVGCVNNVCQRLAADAQKLIKGTLDGVYALTHPFGCSQLGQDHENIKKLLCAVSQNPNASFQLGDDKAVKVYAYCNIHGLWMTEL